MSSKLAEIRARLNAANESVIEASESVDSLAVSLEGFTVMASNMGHLVAVETAEGMIERTEKIQELYLQTTGLILEMIPMLGRLSGQ